MLVATSGIVVLGSFETIARSVVIAPTILALSVIATVLFVRRERRAPDPLIPPAIFASPGLSRSIVITGIGGAALFGTFTFVPMSVIAGTGYNVSTVSTLLVALTAGQLIIITTFSVVARKLRRMAPWGQLGLVLGIVGLSLLATLPLASGFHGSRR